MKPKTQRLKPTSRAGAWRDKVPVFNFALKFSIFMGIFFALSMSQPFQRAISAAAIAFATLSSAIINVFGEGTRVTGATIYSLKFALNVAPICVAQEYVALVCSMALAFPTSFQWKLIGVVMGLTCVPMFNTTRIVVLFLLGSHMPSVVDMVHEEVFSWLLVVFIVLLCAIWSLGAVSRNTKLQDAPI